MAAPAVTVKGLLAYEDWMSLGLPQVSPLTRPVLDFVVPPACSFCRTAMDSGPSSGRVPIWLCPSCCDEMRKDKRSACRACGMPVGPYAETDECLMCRPRRFRFKQVIRLGVYDGVLRQAVIRGKGRGSETLAESLAALLWEYHAWQLRDLNADCVVPVPQHWLHWFSRPHHQARTVGRVLAECLRIPLRDRLVSKTRRTRDQSSLVRSQRVKNLERAFAVKPGIKLEGRNVLVVDDILTTGTTADEVTRALRNAGAGRVTIAVLAVVPSQKPSFRVNQLEAQVSALGY